MNSDEMLARELRALRGRVATLEGIDLPAGFDVGTSFPVSPATGKRFYRSDLGWLCYYDGARWLTVHEYQADLTWYQRVTLPYTGAAPQVLLLLPLRPDRNYYYTRAKAYLEVATTNNGTNFWSLSLIFGATTVWTFNTSADAPNAGLSKEDATPAVITPTNAVLQASGKTGAPGSLVANCSYWYRLIVT